LDFIQTKLKNYSAAEIRKVDFGQLEAVPVLFHSGYLTIDRVRKEPKIINGREMKIDSYSFKRPNDEVEMFFDSDCLKMVFGDAQSQLEGVGPRFIKSVTDGDAQDVAKLFANLLSGVTHRQHIAEERYYHSLFHAALAASGLDVASEAAGAQGQADMAIRLPGGAVAIIEVKYAQREKSDDKEGKKMKLAEGLDEALKAIVEKDYARPFWMAAKKLIGLGLTVYGRNDVKAGFLEESDLRRSA
jgi:hypothetical protein